MNKIKQKIKPVGVVTYVEYELSYEGNCGIRQDKWDLDEKPAEAEFYHQRSVSLIILRKRSIESTLSQRSDIFPYVDSMLIQCLFNTVCLLVQSVNIICLWALTVNSLYNISHFDMHAPTVSLSRLNIETAYKYPIGVPALCTI